MRNLFYLLSIVVLFSTFDASSESAYIYDKKRSIWPLKGPSKEFGVTKGYKPGTKMEILDEPEKDGYRHVMDEKGVKSWMPLHYLEHSSSALLDEAMESIELLKALHLKEINKLQSVIMARAPLEKQNKKLHAEIALVRSSLEKVSKANDGLKNQFNQDVYFAGGVTVMFGILFGWVFGIKGRKRKDGWG